ncbi:hypothetical protein PSHT_01444, partial [Puccinia striiformis]
SQGSVLTWLDKTPKKLTDMSNPSSDIGSYTRFTAGSCASRITSALQLRQSVPERLSKRIFTIIFERLWVERYQNSHTVNLKEINSVISLVELLVQLKLKDYSFVIYFLPLHNHTRWFMVFVKSIQARCFLPNTLAM